MILKDAQKNQHLLTKIITSHYLSATKRDAYELMRISTNARDHYGKPGCCHTCPNKKPGCLCFECKCRKCHWYEFKISGIDPDDDYYKDYRRCRYYDYH